MQCLGERLRVVVAVDAGRALAGGDRADLRAGAAEIQAARRREIAGRVDLIERNADDLGREARGEHHLAAAEVFGELGDGAQVLGGENGALRDDAPREIFGAAVQKKAARLDFGNLSGFQHRDSSTNSRFSFILQDAAGKFNSLRKIPQKE